MTNAEAIEAWDGPLFERWAKYRHLVVESIEPLGAEAMALHPPPRGGRVLDIGCGFGDTTRQLAALVGPGGSAVGIDAAPRFVQAAQEETREAGADNATFEVVDVEHTPLEESFDYAFSRMGTMFFAGPVPALRNVRAALGPGGTLVMLVWRAKEENDWVYLAQLVTERFVAKPDSYDEPTCGPGPFSMANADTTSGILQAAGFSDVTLRRRDLSIKIGADLDEAATFVMDLGPAGEILRLQGDRAAHLHEPIRKALHEEFAPLEAPDGVYANASTWIVTARA